MSPRASARAAVARAAAVCAAAGVAALSLGPAAAVAQEDGGGYAQGAVLLVIEVGETRSLGPGKIAPVRCDDPTLVEPVASQNGLGLRGLKPGLTLCSVYTAASTYQSYRVQVEEPSRAPAK